MGHFPEYEDSQMYLIQCVVEEHEPPKTIGFTAMDPDWAVNELQAWWDREWRAKYATATLLLDDCAQHDVFSIIDAYDTEVAEVIGIRPGAFCHAMTFSTPQCDQSCYLEARHAPQLSPLPKRICSPQSPPAVGAPARHELH